MTKLYIALGAFVVIDLVFHFFHARASRRAVAKAYENGKKDGRMELLEEMGDVKTERRRQRC